MKKRNKILSLWLCVCMLISFITIPSEATAEDDIICYVHETYYTYDFDSSSPSLNPNKGICTKAEVDEAHGSSAYLSYTGTSKSTADSPYFVHSTLSGKGEKIYVWEFEVNFPDLNAEKKLGVLKYNTPDKTNQWYTPVKVRTDGSISVSHSSGTYSVPASDITIETNTWYKIKLDYYINDADTTLDVFIAEDGGELVKHASGLTAIAAPMTPQYVNVQLGMSDGATNITTAMYVDNFTVYSMRKYSVKTTYNFYDMDTSSPKITNNIGTSGKEILDEAHGNSVYLAVTGTGESEVNSPYFVTTNLQGKGENIVLHEAEYRFDNFSAKRPLMNICYNTSGSTTKMWFNPLHVDTSGNIILNKRTSSSSAAVFKTLMKCKPDTWYKIRMIYNLISDTVTVSVNDAIYYSGSLFDSSVKAADLMYVNYQLSVPAKDVSVKMYIDNVRCASLRKQGSFGADTMFEAEEMENATVLADSTACGSAALDLAASGSALAAVNVEKRGTYKLFMTAKAANEAYLEFDLSGTVGTAAVTAGEYYQLISCGEYVLESGEAQLTLSATEDSGIYVDSLMLVSADAEIDAISAKAWSEPNIAEEYPLLINPDTIGTVSAFEPGDRVAFIGDSITHRSYYMAEIMNYYATRYPDCEFTYVNRGINGNKANNATDRLIWDINTAEFNKVVINFGMNDIGRLNWAEDTLTTKDGDSNRDKVFSSFFGNMQTLISGIRENTDVEQIILAGPTVFDEWSVNTATSIAVSPTFNNAIRSAAAWLRSYAGENGFGYIDFNTPQLTALLYNLESNPEFKLQGDRIHPNRSGDIVSYYAFIKAQGESGEVASVNIDALSGTASANNAAAENISTSTDSVSFSYSPFALPLAADATYREAEAIFPITNELNCEILRISGLSDGTYDVKFDGVTVITATSSQLAEGINIAELKDNPSQKQSLEIKSYIEAKRNAEYTQRSFAETEQGYIKTYSLDKADLINSSLRIAQQNSGTATADTLYSYVAEKLSQIKADSIIKAYEARIYSINTPGSYAVTVTKSDSEAVYISADYETVYYPLPEDTVNIMPYREYENLLFGNAVLADESGIARIPSAGESVSVSVEASNNYVSQEKSVKLIIAAYSDDKLLCLNSEEFAIAALKTETLETPLTVPEGTSELKAFVWSNNAIVPLDRKADFASDNLALKSITINGEALTDFEPDKTSYTVYTDKFERTAPVVRAYAQNKGTLVNVSTSSGSSVITVSDVNGNQRSITVSFESASLPLLSAIYADGKIIDGFDSYTYSYNLSSEPAEITADADDGIEVTVSKNDSGTVIAAKPPKGNARIYTVEY